MMAEILLKAFFTGFFAACLVGPVFILVLYRAVTGGIRNGVVSAIGTACADATYFFIASLGVFSSNKLLMTHIQAFETVGGPLMVSFGLWTLLRRNSSQSENYISFGPALIWQAASTMLLTFSNPLSLIFFGSVARKFFPEIASFSYLKTISLSIILGLGSFTLLFSAILITRWQKTVTPEKLVYFLKTFSGITLLLTGSFLSIKYWIP